jgi:hypothetical protein
MTVLPELNQPVGTFDTHLIPYLIEQGRKATDQQLAFLDRLLVKAARTTWATQKFLLDK